MSAILVWKKIFLFGVLISLAFSSQHAFASATTGSIDTTYKYAWGENIGWLNFGCANCNVVITDSGVFGKAWSRQYGWINLNPSNSGVLNNGEGLLSGFAWSSNLGWINFSGVAINFSGEFIGYATIEQDGSQINFNCANGNSCSAANFKVATDWRPGSVRLGTAGGGGSPGVPFLPPTPTPAPTTTATNTVVENIGEVVDKVSSFISGIFKPTEKPATIVEIPKNAPLSLKNAWNILPTKEIHSFVFAPLPREIRILSSKFPELAKTLKSVGVNRFNDLSKLTGVNLNIPGLANILDNTIKNIGLEKLTDIDQIKGVAINVPGISDVNSKIINSVGAGKISLIRGLPIANFSLAAKKNLPSEFVFPRTSGELVDLNVALSVGEKGEVTQQFSSLPGTALRLVIKPISKAKNITGYIVFKSPTPKVMAQNQISRASLTASALFSMNDLVEATPLPVPVEKKLVLASFEYEDPDGDGIYTADVATPVVPGEYEVITVIDYVDPELGSRKISMVTVIDPEGYVFEKNNGKETRIPSAIVSLYYLNTATKKYELWPAKDYQQENPQITDIRGTYSFLVPSGSYYFEVEAPGYNSYTGKVFVVTEGSGVHQNIELKSGNWFSAFDYKTALLVVVLSLLVYNLYRNRQQDKLLQFLNKNGK